MKRALHSPWLVALAVLALAALPVLAALASHREQAQRAEALLFERSAEVVAGQLRLVVARQMGWLNTLRARLSSAADAPEKQLDELLAPDSWITPPENCRVLGYGAHDGARTVLRWQRTRAGKPVGAMAGDLAALPEIAQLLRTATAKSAQLASVQSGMDLLTAMTVNDPVQRRPRGWVVAAWDLGAMCADPQLRLIVADHTLTARPLEGPAAPSEHVVEIGEGDARWRASARSCG